MTRHSRKTNLVSRDLSPGRQPWFMPGVLLTLAGCVPVVARVTNVPSSAYMVWTADRGWVASAEVAPMGGSVSAGGSITSVMPEVSVVTATLEGPSSDVTLTGSQINLEGQTALEGQTGSLEGQTDSLGGQTTAGQQATPELAISERGSTASRHVGPLAAAATPERRGPVESIGRGSPVLVLPDVPTLSGTSRTLAGLAGTGVTIEGRATGIDQLIALGSSLEPEATEVIYQGPHLVVSAATTHEVLAPGDTTEMVVRVAAPPSAPRASGGLRVHLVIDASRSMELSWDAVTQSIDTAVRTLRPSDEVEIIVYSDDARVLVPLTRVRDLSNLRSRLRSVRLRTGSNIEAGLRLAFASTAHSGDSLVLLVSDGFPQGGAADAPELSAVVERGVARGNVKVCSIGYGTSIGLPVLSAIAHEGSGSVSIAPNAAQLGAAIRQEIEMSARVAARDINIRIEVPTGNSLVESHSSVPTNVLGNVLSIRAPRISAGDAFEVRVSIRVPATGTGAFNLARTTVSSASSSGSAVAPVTETTSVRRGSRSQFAGYGHTVLVSLDQHLGDALMQAGSALELGQVDRATAALSRHIARANAFSAERPLAQLQARTDAAERVRDAISELNARASWPERRQVAQALSARGLELGGSFD